MLKRFLLNLQLFGEGGDGGEGGSPNPAGESVVEHSGEDKILASIPEKAKKYYEKAKERTQKSEPKASQPQTTTTEKSTTEKIPYADLIKSDDYKDAHKEYMDKTIGDRLKKYKGIEEDLGKHKEILDIVANKYGVNSSDENFLEVLMGKIEADDSYYEEYAMEHDISTEEARRIVTMQRKVDKIEAQEQQRQREEQARQQFMVLQQNAQKTKAQFPEFDLETMMQDEKFRRLCAVTNGDTTASYMACQWNSIVPNMVQNASKQAQMQTVRAVASNNARPIENGLSSSASSVVETNFANMSLTDLRAWASEQRRKKK